MRRVVFYTVWLSATVLMLVPANEVSKAFEFWDKAQHAMAFFVLTGLAMGAGWMRARIDRVAVAMLVYGAAIECVQAVLPWRSGDVLDWLADAVGVIGLVIVVRYFPKLIQGPRRGG